MDQIIELVSPYGEVFKIDNLKNFCFDKKIDYPGICKLIFCKKYIHCNGWMLNKPLFLKFKNGKIHEVKGLYKFCDENKLNAKSIIYVIRGSLKTNKGWSLAGFEVENIIKKRGNIFIYKNEKFKTLEDYPGYFFGEMGNILSTRKNRIFLIKTNLNKYGYVTCGLTDKNKKLKNLTVHRLIAKSWLPNDKNYPVVLHLNDIKSDNRVENLRWGSHKENTRMAMDKGLMNYGESVNTCKLSEKEVLEIYNLYEDGHTRPQLAIKYKVTWGTIDRIVKKKGWKNILKNK